MSQIIKGIDNYGKPRQEYADKIAAMTDTDLVKETMRVIYLSAYVGNDLRSDSDWQRIACSKECYSRGSDKNLYSKAYKKAWE